MLDARLKMEISMVDISTPLNMEHFLFVFIK
jgi:hypothetical protein